MPPSDTPVYPDQEQAARLACIYRQALQAEPVYARHAEATQPFMPALAMQNMRGPVPMLAAPQPGLVLNWNGPRHGHGMPPLPRSRDISPERHVPENPAPTTPIRTPQQFVSPEDIARKYPNSRLNVPAGFARVDIAPQDPAVISPIRQPQQPPELQLKLPQHKPRPQQQQPPQLWNPAPSMQRKSPTEVPLVDISCPGNAADVDVGKTPVVTSRYISDLADLTFDAQIQIPRQTPESSHAMPQISTHDTLCAQGLQEKETGAISVSRFISSDIKPQSPIKAPATLKRTEIRISMDIRPQSTQSALGMNAQSKRAVGLSPSAPVFVSRNSSPMLASDAQMPPFGAPPAAAGVQKPRKPKTGLAASRWAD